MVKYEKYQTPAGKELWKYSAYSGFDKKTGKKIQPRGQGFTSKTEAKLDYERKIEEIKKAKTHPQQKPIKFERLFEEYLTYYKESGIKPGTYRKFKLEITKHALPLLGDIYVDQMDVDDCQKTFDVLKKNRKDYRKIKNQIKTILDFGITKQYIETNPMDYILISKTDFHYKKKRLSSDENYYTPELLMKFLEAYQEVEEYHKFVYFRLLAFTGLRRGEALALYETDILKKEKALDITKTLAEDEHGKTYVSHFPKTEESKNLVYLDDDTFHYIDKLIKDRNSFDTYGKVTYFQNNRYLFPSPKTSKHYARNAPNEWLRLFFDWNDAELTKRGIYRISPHGFRHSQATLLYELGVDPKDAQYRLRHKNLKTTMDVYTHLSEQKKRSPLLKLDEFSASGAISGATSTPKKQTKPQK